MMDGYGRFYTFFSIQKMGISAEKRQMQIKTAAVSGGFPKTAACLLLGIFPVYDFMPAQRRDKAGQTSGGDDSGSFAKLLFHSV